MFVRGIISDSSDNHSLAILFFPYAAVGLPEYLRSKTKFFGIVVQMDTDKPGSVFMCGFLHTPVSPVNFRRERVRADRDDDLAESGAQDPCRRR